jgi:RNA polymerase sigma-70 factor (ECF subfamily)
MTTIQLTQGIQEHQSMLKRFALSLTKNNEDANDLVQDTTYRALKYRSMFKVGTNLNAWLVTIMRNIFLNNYRKKKRQPTLINPEHDDIMMNTTTLKIVNDADSNIHLEEISAMCNDLRDEYKAPFKLYCQGYKYNEIADILGSPIGTIKSRIFFARRELRDRYKHRYNEAI